MTWLEATRGADRSNWDASMMNELRETSGNVSEDSPLVVLLYLLARDHLPVGVLQNVLFEALADGKHAVDGRKAQLSTPTLRYCNGWLAEWANYHACKLLEQEDQLR